MHNGNVSIYQGANVAVIPRGGGELTGFINVGLYEGRSIIESQRSVEEKFETSICF